MCFCAFPEKLWVEHTKRKEEVCVNLFLEEDLGLEVEKEVYGRSFGEVGNMTDIERENNREALLWL